MHMSEIYFHGLTATISDLFHDLPMKPEQFETSD